MQNEYVPTNSSITNNNKKSCVYEAQVKLYIDSFKEFFSMQSQTPREVPKLEHNLHKLDIIFIRGSNIQKSTITEYTLHSDSFGKGKSVHLLHERVRISVFYVFAVKVILGLIHARRISNHISPARIWSGQGRAGVLGCAF